MPSSLFFFTIVLAIHGPLGIHMHFSTVFTISEIQKKKKKKSLGMQQVLIESIDHFEQQKHFNNIKHSSHGNYLQTISCYNKDQFSSQFWKQRQSRLWWPGSSQLLMRSSVTSQESCGQGNIYVPKRTNTQEQLGWVLGSLYSNLLLKSKNSSSLLRNH